MEHFTRRHTALQIVAFLLFTLQLSNCKSDNATEVETTKNVVNEESIKKALQGPDGRDVSVENIIPVAGEIADFGDRDIRSEGREQGRIDKTSDVVGFAGVSPCAVIKSSDLEDWPGGVGNVSSERNNIADIVLGCIYTFQGDAKRPGGRISVYFSDNQSPELAAESVSSMPTNSGGSARLVSDWDLPAAFDPKTGEFVWSRGRNFITLLIEHPSIKDDQEKWSKKIAKQINARL